jgi:hypothetical protein
MQIRKVKRSQAAELLDLIRADLAERIAPEKIEAQIARGYGRSNLPALEPLKRCDAPAHFNPYIDNCGACMPRWGITGDRVVVT